MKMTRRTVMETAAGSALLAMASACARPDQKASNELAALDAVETASRIYSGGLSAQEAVESAIERAERIDRKINAIAFKRFDAARDAVKDARGPWAGVPTFIKDLDDIAGAPSAFGSRAFPGYKGTKQTPVIDAYLALGVVSLGKSATPEFGLTATTEPLSKGATRNPWNTDHSTGGSSGGAAALVAAGVVPVAHASDGGGSIRIPASCCGNVGLKVSRNRYPEGRPELAGPLTIAVHGVQSRTVRDTAAVIAAVEAPSAQSRLPAVGLVSGPNARRLRIGMFLKGADATTLDPQVRDATMQAARLCEDLGHAVSEIETPFSPGIVDAFLLYWARNAEIAVQKWEEVSGLKRNGLAFEPFTLGLIERLERERDKFDGAVAELVAVGPKFEAMFANIDVLLSPVVTTPPPEIGYLSSKLPYEEHLARVLAYAQFTGLYNIAGAPAISLPLSMSDAGLPIGTMFGARNGDERTLLELAYELEEAAPWSARRPPIFG